MTLATRLKERRKELKMTQVTLAELTGVSQQAINRIESGVTGCGVREEFSVTNKQKRILDAFEAPLSSRFLWAHTDVLDGPMYDQMRDFNPALTNQPDDFIDSGAGAISATPVRIGKVVGIPTGQSREHWQLSDGDHEVEVDY